MQVMSESLQNLPNLRQLRAVLNQAEGPESNQLCGHAIKQLNLGRRFHELLRNLEPALTTISFADQK